MRTSLRILRRHWRLARRLIPVILSLQLALYPVLVQANPMGGTVVGGNASISAQGSTLTVTQGSDRAIINWNGFSIGAGEVTKFVQPSSSAAILNRVTGTNPSALLGTMQANGQVFLINPHGILVGPNAQINVGAFTASTLDVQNQAFMNWQKGGELHFQGTSNASVINYGAIRAVEGDIYLIGAHVANYGSLSAPRGTVGMAAGQDVRLVDSAHPGLVVRPTAASLGGTGVHNAGTIDALQAELVAAHGNVYALAINNEGTVRANTVVREGGRIMLRASGGVIRNRGDLIAKGENGAGGQVTIDAGPDGQAQVSGKVDVSGATTGGRAEIAGGQVDLAGAQISASGQHGGGTVLVGGDRQGGGDLTRSQQTTVDADSSIKADALQSGHGGVVVVWSDGSTQMLGTIAARGGPQGGDGGFIEVSGRQSLVYGGHLTALAPAGRNGQLLLDPGTVDVGGGSMTFTADQVKDLWLNGNVTISTAVDGTNGLVEDINVFADLFPADILADPNMPVASANSLSLIAGNNVNLMAAVSNPGSGGFTATALGAVAVQAPVTLGGGDLLLDAGAGIAIDQPINVGLGAVRLLSGAAIAQGAGAPITASALGVRAGLQATLGADNSVATLGANVDSLTFKNTQDLVLGSVSDSGAFLAVNGLSGVNALVVENTGTVQVLQPVTSTAGDVLLSATGDLTIAQPVSAVPGTVRLASGAAIAQGAGAPISASALGVRAALQATLGADNSVATLGANVDSLTFKNTQDLVLGSVSDSGAFLAVNGLSGVNALVVENTGSVQVLQPVTSTAGDVLLSATGDLTIAQPISAVPGTVRLGSGAAITQGAGGPIAASALGVRAGLQAVLTANNSVGTLAASADSLAFTNLPNLVLGSVGASGSFAAVDGVSTLNAVVIDNTGTLQVAQAVNTVFGDVLLSSGGNLAIDQPIAASLGTVRLASGAGIAQGAGGPITASALGVRSNMPALLGADNRVSTLAAAVGSLDFRNTQNLVLGNVPGSGTFAAVDGVTATGAAAIVNQGTVLVSRPVFSAGGDLLVDATSGITIDQPINVGPGTVRLATGAALMQNATGPVIASALGVRSTLAASLTAANSVATLAASAGSLNFSNTQNLTIGSVSAAGTFAALDGIAAGGGVTVVNQGALLVARPVVSTFNDVLLDGTGNLTLDQSVDAAFATVRLRSDGAIAQNAGGVVSAAALGVRASSAATLTAPNSVATLAVAAGSLDFSNTRNLVIGSVTAAPGFAAVDGLTAAGAAVVNQGALLVAQPVVSTFNDVLLDATGNLTLDQPVNVDFATLRLATGGVLAQSAGGTITAATLGTRSTGATLLGAANSVGTFAAAAPDLGLNNTRDLVIGAVGAAGTFAATDGIAAANTVVIDNAGAVLIARPVAVTAGSFLLTGLGNISQSGAGTITAAAAIGVRNESAITGDIVLNQANSAAFLAAYSAAPGGKVEVGLLAGFTLGSASGGLGGVVFTNTSGVTTNDGDVLLSSGGGITLQSGLAAGAGTARLIVNGDVAQDTFSAFSAVTAAALGVRNQSAAAGNIAINNAANHVGTFAASNAFDGGQISYVDNGSLAVGSVPGAVSGPLFFPATAGIAATGTGPVAVDAAILDVQQPIASSSGPITLTADAINVAAVISGTGDLLLQPRSPITSIGLGAGAGDFQLSQAEIDLLADGFSSISIGRPAAGPNPGRHLLTAQTASFRDPLVIHTPGRTPLPAGEVHLDGLVGTDDASFTINGSYATTYISGVNGNPLAPFTINDNVVVVGDATLLGTVITINPDPGIPGSGTVDLQGFTLTLKAESIVFAGPGTVFGGGALGLEPNDPAADIQAGNFVPPAPPIGPGGLVVDAGALAAPDSTVTLLIGGAAGQHSILVGQVTFNSPTTIRAPVGPGNITVLGQVTSATGNTPITMIAGDFINVLAPVFNDGTGAITLTADADTGGAGDVIIGDGTQTAGLFVGSRHGTTTVSGHNLNLLGSTTTADAFAQLGYRGAGAIDGAIVVNLANDLTAIGGTAGSYAQAGHGGLGQAGDFAAPLALDLNNLTLAGGTGDNAYAQIGHGDFAGAATGQRLGDIEIRVAGESSLVDGGGAGAGWLIGHRTATAGGVTANVTLLTGTLDHDTATTSTLATLDQSFADVMMANLAGGHVTIAATNGTQGATGGMSVDGAFLYDSPNNLSFVSTIDVRIGQSVLNGGSGQVNVVAGWDGATGIASPLVIGDILGNPASYGVNNGSVFIGDAAQPSGTAVGTRFGATSVAAYDLVLRASDTTADAFAQLGYRADSSQADFDINGPITVALQNDLAATAGTRGGAYVQVGHGGNDLDAGIELDGSYAGDITVVQAHDLVFTAGGAFGYAQLGHGGINASGNHSGAILITEANDLTFTAAGGAGAYAQLGHGGAQAGGDYTGDITITRSHDLTFTAGGGLQAYAHFGHGGVFTNGNHSGAIVIAEANDLTFTGAGGFSAYAQLGHGGAQAGGDYTGDIAVTLAHDLTFTAGTGFQAYAQLGHGGVVSGGNHSGAIAINEANDLTFTAGSGHGAYAQLGHGGAGANGDASGAVTIAKAHDLTFTGGAGLEAYAQLGHGGYARSGNASGAIAVLQANSVTLASGTGFAAYAQLGNGGFGANGDQSGAIELVAANLTLDASASTGASAYAQVGHGDASFTSSGQRTGNIDLRVSGETSLVAGVAPWWIGHATTTAGGVSDANVTLITSTLDHDAAGTSTLVALDQPFADNMSANMAGGHVTVGASNTTQGPAGGMLVEGNFVYDGPNNLTLLANADLRFQAGPQNSGSGQVTAVAGWDYDPATLAGAGLGAPTATFDLAAFLAAGTGFGNNSGSVFVGDGAQAAGVAVGSSQGPTSVFGYDIVLDSSTNFSQIGFAGDGDHTGVITATALHHVALLGTGTGGTAQIGHGGAGATGSATGQIDVMALGADDAGPIAALRLAASADSSTAQIGHGGRGYTATGLGLDAIINVTATAGSVSATAGGADSVAQIGHGGSGATASMGDIVVTGLSVELLAAGPGSTAQYGHGGPLSSGDHSGNITVQATGTNPGEGYVRLEASGGASAALGGSTAQIGHGGREAQGSATGDIAVTAAGPNDVFPAVSLLTIGDNNMAQIGHGGVQFNANTGTLGLDGAIGLSATQGGLSATAGGNSSPVQVGHGGSAVLGDASGAIALDLASDVTFAGGSGTNAYAQLGHGGNEAMQSAAGYSGAITIAGAAGLSFTGGGATNAYSQLGHRGSMVMGDGSGAIVLDLAGDVTFAAGSGAVTYAQLGHGGYQSRGNSSGAITIAGAAGLSFTGGGATNAYAQLGHGGNTALGDASGAIALDLAGDVTFTAGSDDAAYAQLGHGGNEAMRSAAGYSGDITLAGAAGLSFTGGGATHAYAQLGHGGAEGNGARTGDITITLAHDLTFTAGSGPFACAQLGHGGVSAEGNNSGAITIAGANDLTFTGGSDLGAYAQLGHGGYFDFGDYNGAITVTQAADIAFSGGSGAGAYAQLGHGGQQFQGSLSGDVLVVSAASLTLTGGAGGNYAQVGHGGQDGSGSATGLIDLTVTGGVTLLAPEAQSTAQIGHGGRNYVATGAGLDGAISVVAGGAVGGTASGQDSIAQIGHGGFGASASMGDILVTGLSVELLAAGPGSTAQIGHGGPLSSGDHTGIIAVAATGLNPGEGYVRLEASGGASAALGGSTAQIGHGGREAQGNAAGDIALTAAGPDDLFAAVWLLTAGDDNMAQIGHGGVRFNSSAAVAGSLTGAIDVAATLGSVTAAAGGLMSPVQIGHGGMLSVGDLSGNVTLSATGEVRFQGGTADTAYAQSGHGGFGSAGELSGDILVAGAGLTLTGGPGSAYAQVGHGGQGGAGSATGLIDLTITGGVTLLAPEAQGAAQIGHGGRDFVANATGLNGLISVVAGGTVTATAGGEDSVAQIGHGGFGAAASAGDIDVSGLFIELWATGPGSSAQIGHGGPLSSGDRTGNIAVAAAGLNPGEGYVRLEASGGASAALGGSAAQIGHGGREATGSASGDIAVTAHGPDDASGAVSLEATGDNGMAQVGHGGARFGSGPAIVDSLAGAIDVTATQGSIWAAAGGENSPVQIGHGGPGSLANAAGDTTISAAGDLDFTGGSGRGAYAQLGHGGLAAAAGQTGHITIASANDLNFAGGSGLAAYAQLGHNGAWTSGDIAIAGVNDLNFAGGAGDTAYAQLGLGGPWSANNDGAITIAGANNLTFAAGAGMLAYAQLGHGGISPSGVNTGDITVSEVNDLTFAAGSVAAAFARLGHGGAEADGGIVISGANDLAVAAGAAEFAFAQIGHGNPWSAGNRTGDIMIAEANELRLTAGTADFAFAQVGHGGAVASGQFTGSIAASVGGVALAGGTTDSAYSQIGHGGHGAGTGGPTSATGDIMLLVQGPADLIAGAGSGAAQIGHGGQNAQGTATGDIFLLALGPIEVSAPVAGGMAQIGHGGCGFQGDALGTIALLTLEDLTLAADGAGAEARIGHGGPGHVPGPANLLAGDIGVGAFGDIVLDARAPARAQIGHGQLGALNPGVPLDATEGNILAVWDIAGQLAGEDGGGRLTLRSGAVIGVGGAAANEVRLFGFRRGMFMGPSPWNRNVYENGAVVGGYAYNDAIPRAILGGLHLRPDGWRENYEFFSWEHQQWGFPLPVDLSKPFGVDLAGLPYTAPFTFYYADPPVDQYWIRQFVIGTAHELIGREPLRPAVGAEYGAWYGLPGPGPDNVLLWLNSGHVFGPRIP